eukprot:6152384-Alexandrium_andersonii.AAC.1
MARPTPPTQGAVKNSNTCGQVDGPVPRALCFGSLCDSQQFFAAPQAFKELSESHQCHSNPF